MAKNSITDYSKTAASNTDIQSVDIAEGCLPSGINNAIREIMADLADMNDGTVSLTSPAFTSVDINGGTIDGTVIGGTTAAAGTFTTGQFNTSLNVDGTVTADGLTVDGSATLQGTQAAPDEAYLLTLKNLSDGGAGINFDNNVTANFAQIIGDVEGTGAGTNDGVIRVRTANNGTLHDSLRIDADGDISFYEDTGTTAKFFWDASAEALGIGTSSPEDKLSLDQPYVASGQMAISFNQSNFANRATKIIHEIDASGNGGSLLLATNPNGGDATERMRIDSSGNVGIGTSSPEHALSVFGDSNGNRTEIGIDNIDQRLVLGAYFESGVGQYSTIQSTNNAENSSTNLALQPDGGNVGIGTSSPTSDLTFGGATPTISTDTSDASDTSRLSIGGGGNATSTGRGSLVQYHGNEHASAAGAMKHFMGNASGSYISWHLGSGTEAMRIDSSGNVGIGTSSPAEKLAVNGNIDFPSASSTIGYDGSSGGTSRFAQIEFYNSSDGSMRLSTDNSSTGGINFYTEGSERMRIARGGNVGIGTSSPNGNLDVSSGNNSNSGYVDLYIGGTDSSNARSGIIRKNTSSPYDMTIKASNYSGGNDLIFDTGAGEKMRIDSSGNVLVGTTDALPVQNNNANGIALRADGNAQFSRSNAATARFNRGTSDGEIVSFGKNGTTVGSIGVDNLDNLYIQGTSIAAGLQFGDGGGGGNVLPHKNGADVDNTIDLGSSSRRFDDIYATNGTIQTSDQNEKQQIASLTDAEITAAKAISKLFKTFKWNDKVEAKGDAARTHTGVIAQDVQQAMANAGLDAGDYAFFISTTWWETQTEVPAVEAVEAQDAVYDDDGNLVSEAVEAVEARDAYTRTDTYEIAEEAPEGATERTRLGIRYPELLAFVGAATEQRLADIETRLTALEN